MSYRIIDKDNERCQTWIKAQMGTCYVEDVAIGLEKDGELIAVATYGRFNTKSMHCHLCIKPGARLTRAFCWYVAYYAFIDNGVDVLIGMISSGNEACLKLARHIGFKLEHTIQGACPDGDMIIMTLCKYNARPLNYKVRFQNV